MGILIKAKMGRPSKKNRIKILSNRAMIYLNGKSNKVALCSLEDVENLRKYTWCLSASLRNGEHREGYVSAYSPVLGRRILMHRLVMGNPEGVIDHINHNTVDNRRHNLQVVSNAFNIFRTPKWGSEAGVSFDKSRNKWEAYISKNDKKVHLGRFESKDAAITARKKAEILYFGVHKPGG